MAKSYKITQNRYNRQTARWTLRFRRIKSCQKNI